MISIVLYSTPASNSIAEKKFIKPSKIIRTSGA
jgi:hypothetical protein